MHNAIYSFFGCISLFDGRLHEVWKSVCTVYISLGRFVDSYAVSAV
jgi:hypothetical protein